MELKSEFNDALYSFYKEVGVPIALVVNPSGEKTSKVVRKFCNQAKTTLRILEESTQWVNRAELYTGFLKKAIRKDFLNSNCPMILWNYYAQRRALTHNLTPRYLFQAEKQSPYQYRSARWYLKSMILRLVWLVLLLWRKYTPILKTEETFGTCTSFNKERG